MEHGDIREYLPHFVYALMKSGATPSTINSFRAYWNALPPETPKLPCPLCYATGRQGGLQAAKSESGSAVRCDRCREIFLVSRH
jgi:hypothetical protein